MLKLIISTSSNPGDIVLDCFAGSGTTLVAAEELGRQWIGVDIGDEAIRIIQERFAHGTKPLGDYVSKRKDGKQRIQTPSLFDNAEDDAVIKQDECPETTIKFQLFEKA